MMLLSTPARVAARAQECAMPGSLQVGPPAKGATWQRVPMRVPSSWKPPLADGRRQVAHPLLAGGASGLRRERDLGPLSL